MADVASVDLMAALGSGTCRSEDEGETKERRSEKKRGEERRRVSPAAARHVAPFACFLVQPYGEIVSSARGYVHLQTEV